MKSIVPTRWFILGLAVGLLGGLLILQSFRFGFIGYLFAACIAALAISQCYEVVQARTGNGIRVCLRFAAGVFITVAGIAFFGIATGFISEIVSLAYFLPEHSTLAHQFQISIFGNATLFFAAYLIARAFRYDSLPAATIIAALLLVGGSWFCGMWLAQPAVPVAIASLCAYAVGIVVMIRADLIDLGVDLGQRNARNPESSLTRSRHTTLVKQAPGKPETR